MPVDLSALKDQSRLLFEVPLKPLQGQRFQPTGFPNLGAATFKTSKGDCLLVESAQSMANRLEATIWDATTQRPVAAVEGISHVRVLRQVNGQKEAKLLTDSILEPHRLNSPYLLESSDTGFFDVIKQEVGAMEDGPIDRKMLGETLLKYDVGSLLHGVFLAKKELAGGRLRVARALSAFIEAEGVRIAASGGVKNDHVNPSGKAKDGFGNVPFSRDEFTAEKITLFVNLDLAQLRGYGLGDDVVTLLSLLALYKVRKLVDGDLRLRTACDLAADRAAIVSTNVAAFSLPSKADIEAALVPAIKRVNGTDGKNPRMLVKEVKFNDKLETSKEDKESTPEDQEEAEVGGKE
jgi:CRISPR-associated protein Csb1